MRQREVMRSGQKLSTGLRPKTTSAQDESGAAYIDDDEPVLSIRHEYYDLRVTQGEARVLARLLVRFANARLDLGRCGACVRCFRNQTCGRQPQNR